MSAADYDPLREKLIEEAWLKRGYDDAEDFIECHVEQATQEACIEEPICEGEEDGVKWRSSWLGGALHFFIFESPVVVKCELCSPCVPNAGNLGTEGDFDTYGVPADWLAKEFS